MPSHIDTIRAERAEKDRKIIEQGKRIRALEDENKRIREEARLRSLAYTERRVELAREAEANTWKRRLAEEKEAADAELAEQDQEIRDQAAEITRLQALADRRWLAYRSTSDRARRHAKRWRLSEARKQVWVQRALRLEEQRAAVRSVIATWEHRTHHGDSGPMDLLAALQSALRDRPSAPADDTHPTERSGR